MNSTENSNDLFFNPTVTHYDSHSVMSNVHKPTKTKYVNVDTKFRDDYNSNFTAVHVENGGTNSYNNATNYTITFPDRLTNIKTMKILSAEIPITYFNTSAYLGNNYLKLVNQSTGVESMIVLPDQNYTADTITTALNTLLAPFNLAHAVVNHASVIHNLSGTGAAYLVYFNTTADGGFDKYGLKSKLGWVLGFRSISVLVTATAPQTSSSFIDLTNPRYLYIVLDEFNNSLQNSFTSPLFNSQINKKILSRVAVDSVLYPFGTVIFANEHLGSIVSDTRAYNGKIDIQRIAIQLVNEHGIPMNLNGLDFSFILQLSYE